MKDKEPGSSLTLQQEDLRKKCASNDTIVSPGNRQLNLKESFLGDVKKMMITWSREKFWKVWAEKHEYGELKAGKRLC